MNLRSFYDGKVVIITGGSTGIGRELARQCGALGASVVLTGRRKDKLAEAYHLLDIPEERILLHAGDVTDSPSNINLVEKVLDKFGKIDVLINNAGVTAYGSLEDIDLDVYEKVLNVNIKGALDITKSCIAALTASRGSILFISSIAGLIGLPGHSAYSTAKMALRSIAHALHIELHRKGVFVGISYVGFTENDEQKTVMNPKGVKEPIPARPAFLTTPRKKTAKRILWQIASRRYSMNHSPLGKLVMFMIKTFPAVSRKLIRQHFNKTAVE